MSDADPRYSRSRTLLSRGDCRLLIVDMQEKFMSLIASAGQVTENCRRLLAASRILGVPAEATEQYPQRLGDTVPPLAELIEKTTAKLRFSSVECLGWTAPAAEDRHQVVVAGIETHVCILQTSLDLLALGFDVSVPADAVASRSEADWRFALQRLRDSGVTITTTESVLFEWCEVAGTPEFKEISRLITGR